MSLLSRRRVFTNKQEEPLPSGKLYDLAVQIIEGSDAKRYGTNYMHTATAGSSSIYVLEIPKGANRCKITSNNTISYYTNSYGFFTNIYPVENNKIYYSKVKPIDNFYIKEIEFEIDHSYNFIVIPARRYEVLVADRFVEFLK